jgi:2-polyprenyl-3-methyl-5-hydroxy-6-metoxy-1,4-benzoquinol methylase
MISPWRFLHYRHATYEGLQRTLRETVDPWHFNTSRYEQVRFDKTLTLAQTAPHARILELGCAEGHFTQRLVTIADAVTAADLSAAAIERARLRAPEATFLVMKAEDVPLPEEPYDLIVCAEMLYYVEDVPALVHRLRRLGRYLLTSTIYPSALRIHHELHGCRPLRSMLHTSLREMRATSIRLWEL